MSEIEETRIIGLLLKCNNFIIDWTPKAGCTIVKKMWFDYMNVLSEALEHEVYRGDTLIKGWVHDFGPIFYERFGKVTLDELESDDFIKIKYVRNPYDRAPSSYIHCCKHPHLLKEHEDKNPTFKEFLNLIITQNIEDGHYRIQNHQPGIKYDEIIKLENLESETKRLNQKYNINLNWNFDSRHRVKKLDKVDNFFNVPASDIKKLLDKDAALDARCKVPSYDSFYNDEIKGMVYKIYKMDIDNYGYEFPY